QLTIFHIPCQSRTSQARIDVTGDHSLFSNGKEKTVKKLKPKDNVDIYPSKDYGGDNISINENKAWLLGFFIAEGSIYKHNKPNKRVFFNKDGSLRKLRKVNHYDITIN
ncbi:unnamed protein product, partial [marine sediment metagenome]